MFEIEKFQYTFKNGKKKIFLNQSFCIKDGEIVLVTGPSGAGKSTFLKLLKGLVPTYSSGVLEGKISWNKHDSTNEILYLFQNPFSQLIYSTVGEEFFFSMENYNFSNDKMNTKKEELKSFFDVDQFNEKKTADISNGECQRLVLASLIAADSKVLLLDEPTAFLDKASRAVFYNMLLTFKGKRTVVIVDHLIEEIAPFVDKIIEIKADGEVTQSSKAELNTSYDKKVLSKQPWFEEPNEASFELKLSNLSFGYQENKLLDHVSLVVSSGEIIVIKGKNGEGKSTLLKLMAKILKPQNGSVDLYINNKKLSNKNHLKEVGFIFQNPETHFFYDTITEELGRNASNESIKHFLNGVDLSLSPFLLSEGEKRRLSILLTLLDRKNVLLYDEPTFGQDFNSINWIKETILLLKQSGKIQVIISHDDNFINSLGAKVFVLEDQSIKVASE